MIDGQNISAHAGLRYVHDDKPGIRREQHGKVFTFYDVRGHEITAPEEIKRINALAIPPAYRDVWICPHANGHIQATGIDDRGRKQYRYHAKWRAACDENKFEHTLRFGEMLPELRKKVAEHMKLPGLQREKVLATVVELLEKTLIRVGNSEYARNNKSYGLTTLRKKHVSVKGSEVSFEFMGKSGKKWNLAVHDRRIAAVVKRCADIPGYELFKYIDEKGHQKDVGSADVNAYLKEISGEDFTAKDFRTWSGTVLAALALKEFQKYDNAAQAKKNVLRAIEATARKLGNTPAICRKCYIHPEVINGYLSGDFKEIVEHEIDEAFQHDYEKLTSEEVVVLAFLRRKLNQTDKPHFAQKAREK